MVKLSERPGKHPCKRAEECVKRGCRGQLSLDVLVGLTIFMITFIFILQYLPSIFVVQRSDISLSSSAYRVAALLAESPGYWTNGSCNGTDWENHWRSSDVTVRVGLCAGEPGELSLKKVLNFSELYRDMGYDYVADMFGIRNYNISLQYLYSNSTNPVYSYYNGKPLLVIGKPVPEYGDVVRYERIVYFTNATFTYNITNTQKGVNRTRILNVSAPVGTFTVIVTNTSLWGSGWNSWVQVKASRMGWGGPKIVRIPSYGGSLTPGVYNLASQISSRIPGIVNLTVVSHDVAGYVVYSSAGQYVAGRVAAKLVVCVW